MNRRPLPVLALLLSPTLPLLLHACESPSASEDGPTASSYLTSDGYAHPSFWGYGRPRTAQAIDAIDTYDTIDAIDTIDTMDSMGGMDAMGGMDFDF